MSDTSCTVCGTALPPRPVTGRPTVYCSTRCRRSRENELRRLRRLVPRLEAERAEIIARDRVWEKRKPAIWTEKIAAAQAEIADLTA